MNDRAAGALPLDEKQSERLHVAVAGLSPMQLQWVSGYAAGLAAAGGDVQPLPVAPAATPGQQLTVLFGSQTGNGEGIAEQLVALARERGFGARAVSLADFKPAALKRESLATFVVSTHGEGDPPDDAELFHEYLMSDKAGRLSGLKYSVLALGDSSYVNFCRTGREFDARLAELGAERFESIVECDLDYDAAAAAWSTRVVDRLADLLDAPAPGAVPRLQAVPSAPVHGRESPFAAEVLVNQKITGAGSGKDVRHIELSIEGSGLDYEPGDSLAVVTGNPPQLVDELLDVLSLDREAIVAVGDEQLPLIEALTDRLEITALNLGFLRAWAAHGNSDALHSIIENDDQAVLSGFLEAHQVVDVVRRYPADVKAREFADMLRPLSPRSYSIASSAAANPGEVHLTVAAVRYEAFGRPHWGAASTLLADRLSEGDTVPVFVEKNPRFRLPAPDVPIVMIGPGTGVAPFRAFVEERVEQNAGGDSWLFFGDRTVHDDFLYQLEWQRHLKRGDLTRLDVAFSRDQRRKVYVQDRLRERGAELYRWIENGAVVYVCGDAKNMAGDVEEALIDVLAEHGEDDRDAAAARLREMRRAKRYQRDVY
ncbi:MAG: assimilatory sulfite reductase (NADPH) flavoprotein subunit [Proteobacteria bacterium]|nr:assimilatory sulfite reductase (NADPH) flavoprotein subunit [Pseudomonadota bacterium]